MPRLTHRRVTWLVFLVGIGLGVACALVSAALIELHGVGSPRYELRLESTSPLRSAGAEVCGSRESAEFIAARMSPDECDFRFDPHRPFSERRLTILVTSTTRHYGLPRRVDYTQERHVAVVAVLADGRRVAKVVELPDARAWEDEPREVTVRLD